MTLICLPPPPLRGRTGEGGLNGWVRAGGGPLRVRRRGGGGDQPVEPSQVPGPPGRGHAGIVRRHDLAVTGRLGRDQQLDGSIGGSGQDVDPEGGEIAQVADLAGGDVVIDVVAVAVPDLDLIVHITGGLGRAGGIDIGATAPPLPLADQDPHLGPVHGVGEGIAHQVVAIVPRDGGDRDGHAAADRGTAVLGRNRNGSQPGGRRGDLELAPGGCQLAVDPIAGAGGQGVAGRQQAVP